MENNKIKDKIDELVESLNRASKAYYNGADEIMPNYEWDAMFDELTQLEKETGYIRHDSPTQNAGYEAARHCAPSNVVLCFRRNHDIPLSLKRSCEWALRSGISDSHTFARHCAPSNVVLCLSQEPGRMGSQYVTLNVKHQTKKH